MKKISLWLSVLLVACFAMFALGSGSEEGTTISQGSDTVAGTQAPDVSDRIGDYTVVIDSCRLAKSYDDKDVVIVKYIFTNLNDDDSAAFFWTFEDAVYQNGVGLNEAYVLEDNANYTADNQTKEIKKGATLEVEVAYELNDTTSDVEVEVKELISFNDDIITKTFQIAGKNVKNCI